MKHLLLFLLFILFHNIILAAPLYKLLVEESTIQKIIEVEKSGGYYDMDKVIWDERVDGELPLIDIGGLEKQGNTLAVNNAKKAMHDQALGVIEAKEDATIAKAEAEIITQTEIEAVDIDAMVDTMDKTELKKIINWLIKRAKR